MNLLIEITKTKIDELSTKCPSKAQITKTIEKIKKCFFSHLQSSQLHKNIYIYISQFRLIKYTSGLVNLNEIRGFEKKKTFKIKLFNFYKNGLKWSK